MSDLISHAKMELLLVDYDKHKADKLIDIIKIISNQGHSNFSINYIIHAIKNKQFKFETDNGLLESNLIEIEPHIKDLDDRDIETLLILIKYGILSPLTLKDDEWNCYARGKYQSKRLSALFKDGKKGKPYYIDAVVCKSQNDSCFSCGLITVKDTNKQYLLRKCHPKYKDKFPTIYINVEEIEVKKDYWEIYTTEEELDKVREFYTIPTK